MIQKETTTKKNQLPCKSFYKMAFKYFFNAFTCNIQGNDLFYSIRFQLLHVIKLSKIKTFIKILYILLYSCG